MFTEPTMLICVKRAGHGHWSSERSVNSTESRLKPPRADEVPSGGAELSNTGRVEALRAQADRCRRLGSAVLDRRTLDALQALASEYDEEATRLAM